jgi:hypothetical protein
MHINGLSGPRQPLHAIVGTRLSRVQRLCRLAAAMVDLTIK